MELREELVARKHDILLQYLRDREAEVWQLWAILVTSFGGVGYAIKLYLEKPGYFLLFFAATLGGMLLLSLGIFVVLASGYQFRDFLREICNLEEFMPRGIIGKSWASSKYNPDLPKLYKIHLWVFIIGLFTIALLFFIIHSFYPSPFVRSWSLVARIGVSSPILIVSLLVSFWAWLMRLSDANKLRYKLQKEEITQVEHKMNNGDKLKFACIVVVAIVVVIVIISFTILYGIWLDKTLGNKEKVIISFWWIIVPCLLISFTTGGIAIALWLPQRIRKTSIIKGIKQLYDLKKEGILSDSEFEEKKKKLLARM